MEKSQVLQLRTDTLALQSERLGALPLINHFLQRLDLQARLERFVPTRDRRIRLPYAKALGVVLRSVLVERGAAHVSTAHQDSPVGGALSTAISLGRPTGMALGPVPGGVVAHHHRTIG